MSQRLDTIEIQFCQFGDIAEDARQLHTVLLDLRIAQP